MTSPGGQFGRLALLIGRALMTPSPNDLADTGGRDVAAAGHGWQLLRLPVRSDFDPELSKRDLARMWRCSTKTIERYMDPAYVRPRGLRPLPSSTTPLGAA